MTLARDLQSKTQTNWRIYCLDMESEEVLLMDGFTLMDAMSAFEVGWRTTVQCKRYPHTYEL